MVFTLIALLVPALMAALSFLGIIIRLACMAPSASYEPAHVAGTWALDIADSLDEEHAVDAEWSRIHAVAMMADTMVRAQDAGYKAWQSTARRMTVSVAAQCTLERESSAHMIAWGQWLTV